MSTRLMPLILFVGVILQPACGGSKRHSKNNSTAQRYFVLGDPMVMLDGTDQNKTSFLTDANLSSFNNYTLAGFTVFAPKVDTTTVDTVNSQKDLEDQNSTESSETVSDPALYSFEVDGSKKVYKAQGAAFADYPTLEFTQINGVWDISSISNDAVVAEHYSVSADGRVFSILVSDSDELGNYLGALTFTRVDGEQKPLPQLDNAYQYLEGKGLAIGWAAPVKVSVCGDLSEEDQAVFNNSVTAWSTATGDATGTLGSLTYELDYVKAGKPFNDVNQHCINLVKNYRLEDQEGILVFGVTMPVVDYQNFTIVDSHVFVFYDALQRSTKPALNTKSTAIHEMGHFWGLGHEFSRSPRGETLHPSIMGYAGVSTITSWDIAAIQALYPK